MEKAVMKPRRTRASSMNAVNSWSDSQPQGKPKEVQPVIIPPKSHSRSDGMSAPNRGQGLYAHRQGLNQAQALRTHPANPNQGSRTSPSYLQQDTDLLSRQGRPAANPEPRPMARPQLRQNPNGRPQLRQEPEQQQRPMARPQGRQNPNGRPQLRQEPEQQQQQRPMARPQGRQNPNRRPELRQEPEHLSVARPQRPQLCQNPQERSQRRPELRQTQEPRPVERPQPRQEPEPRRPVRPEARKSRNQRPQTNQKAQLKTEALPVLQQGPKAQAAARTEPMLRATPHSVSDMKPRPASVPVPVHAVPPKSTSDETVFKRVRWTTFPWLSKKVVVTFFATFLAFAGGIIYLNMTVPVVNIIVSDRHFGYTASLNEAMEIVYDAVHTLGEEKIDDVNIMTDDKVFYVTQRVDKKTFEENQASVDDIAQYINTYLPGFGVSVNGEETDIVVATKEEADGVLSDLLEYYQNLCDKGTQLVDNEIYSVAYEEDVLVEETKALPLYMKTQEEALQGLIDGRPVAKTHEVESEEETVADIAQAYGIGAENILEVNKDLSAEEELEVGTLVKFFVIEPYFTVVVEGKRVAVEAIDFAVETRKEPRVLKGTSKVEQEGVLGSKDITFTFVSRNGKIDLSNENAYVVLDENVTKEPESRIVLEGTGSTSLGSSASVKISQGSGDVPVMKWPASGTLTSKYRTASRPNHNGIDIANPVGTPIYAAADGTVLFVGWHGGYGNAIVIDHGDGVGTRYAHLSSFNVGAGDTVSKGQTIGGMGNTGNSTGPHLHFEVFINQTGTSYYIDPEAVTYG